MTNSTQNLVGAALVPGLPHINLVDKNKSYDEIRSAMEKAGETLRSRGAERILYYSTAWLSVLGQSFQAKSDLKGTHVDENWYEYGNLPFSFRVDSGFASTMAKHAQDAGYQTKLVDYDGFPVDTGTIVADTHVNKGNLTTNMVSSCVYSDGADTEKLAQTIAKAIAADGKKTAVVAVTGLSGRYFTTEIDLREDHIRSPEDDEWNRKMLDLIVAKKFDEAEKLIPEYAGACKVDMGFKAFSFLKGVGAFEESTPELLAYGSIYGTGAATVIF